MREQEVNKQPRREFVKTLVGGLLGAGAFATLLSTSGEAARHQQQPEQKKKKCPTCNGSGQVLGTCAVCGGSGKSNTGNTCQSCGGSGQRYKFCPKCGGSGEVDS